MTPVVSSMDTSNLHRMESLLQKPPRETTKRKREIEGGREKSARRPIIIVIKAEYSGGATVRKGIDGGERRKEGKKEVKEAGEGSGSSKHAARVGAVGA